MQRINILYTNTVSNFNDTHKKFGITYVEGEEKECIPALVLKRMNLAQGFDDEAVTFDENLDKCPGKRSMEGWKEIPMGEFDARRETLVPEFPVRKLARGNTRAIHNFGVGSYRPIKGANTGGQIRRKELEDHLEDFADWPAYLDACRELPKTTPIYYRVIEGPTSGWAAGLNEDVFGPITVFPCLVLCMRLPSTNHSIKDR